MSSSDDIYRLPDQFHGVVRLFPLPNLILFPHVLQPLHIFEPRYRDLMAEALADDELICMAVLEPGWEPHYEGRPAIAPIACLGKIVSHQQLDDGRFNLLLAGVRRVRLLGELPPLKSFREARVELIDDEYSLQAGPGRAALFRKLLDAFRRVVPAAKEIREHFEQLMGSDLPLGTLTDIVSYTLELPLAFKRRLLAEPCVDLRAQCLIEQLEHFDRDAKFSRTLPDPFPPSFSIN